MANGDPKLRRDAKRLTAEYMKRFGPDVDATQKEAARRAGELVALASSLRQAAIAGGVDLAELNRLEAMAEQAVMALPPPTTQQVSRIEVELIQTPAAAQRLRDEIEALRTENEGFRAVIARHESRNVAGAIDDASGVTESTVGNNAPTGTPSPNIVPIGSNLSENDRRIRQARLNHDAALQGAPVVSADRYSGLIGSSDDPFGLGSRRFDNMQK